VLQEAGLSGLSGRLVHSQRWVYPQRHKMGDPQSVRDTIHVKVDPVTSKEMLPGRSGKLN
jgi:hypothetical protein